MISCGNFELRVYGHWVIAKPNETFFKKFWRTSVLFVRSLISLFWTSGLVCWRNETFLHCKEMGRLLMWNFAVCDFAFAVAQREQTQKGSVTCAIQKSCSSIHPEFWMIVYLITCTFLLLHQFQTLLCSIIVRCCQQILDEFGRNSWFLVLFCKLHQFSELALYNNKNVTIEYAQRAN